MTGDIKQFTKGDVVIMTKSGKPGFVVDDQNGVWVRVMMIVASGEAEAIDIRHDFLQRIVIDAKQPERETAK